jgi:hypothetical protein
VANDHDTVVATHAGLILTAAGALAVAWTLSWVCSAGYSHLSKKRAFLAIGLFVIVGVLSQAYVRQQWLRYLREQALTEVKAFISASQDFDCASSAAIALIQEVELVSRGYRM